jgi:phosphoglycolate phosphatase-like HAD superfamily hydrolase
MTQRSSALMDEASDSYLRVRAPGGGFMVRRASRELLAKVDAVVFDCDGVLIDARRSYDATIRVVTETMVEELTGVKLRLANATPRLISTVRRTGGFNSDWDTTYALTLFSVVALSAPKEGRGTRRREAVERLMSITSEFGSSPRVRGQAAVDSFLERGFPSLRETLDRARDLLGYPRTPPEGRLTSTFDEVYFGAKLFREIHGLPAKERRKGLIELEMPLVSPKTLGSLADTLGGSRLAMVTGRPYIGTAYSLGEKLMSFFERAASMFIGDADVDPRLRTEYDHYRKPNPDALVRAKEKLSSKTMLYVGDSAEDLMMAQNARKRGLEGFLFAGVYQTSPVRADQASFFEREGADLILGTVNQVPSGLLLASKVGGAER